MSGSLGAYPALEAGKGIQQNNNSLMANPGQVVGLANGLNQLKLFPLEQERMETTNQILQLQQMKEQLGLNMQHLDNAASYMLPLLLNDDGTPAKSVSTKDISKSLADMVHEGLVSPQESTAILGNLPSGPNGQEDPVGNVKFVQQHYARTLAAKGQTQQALDYFGQHLQSISTPQGTYIGAVGGAGSGAPGQFRPQSMVGNTVSPEAAAQSQTISVNGQPITAPAGSFMPSGLLPPQAGGSGGGVSQVGGGAAMPGGGGSMPAPLSAGGGAGGVPSPANQPRLNKAAGLPGAGGAPIYNTRPGTTEFQTGMANTAAAAVDRAGRYQQDIFPLYQAQAALEKIPSGKGTEAPYQVSSLINSYAPEALQRALHFASAGLIMTPEQTAAYAEAQKYLTQGQLGAPGATRSNEGLNTAGAATPSTHIPKEAAQLVLRGMIGLRRMEQQSATAFQQSGLPPDKYGAFQTQFANSADPRVYMFDQLAPKDRSALLKSISDPAKKQAFMQAVDRADRTGLFETHGLSQ